MICELFPRLRLFAWKMKQQQIKFAEFGSAHDVKDFLCVPNSDLYSEKFRSQDRQKRFLIITFGEPYHHA